LQRSIDEFRALGAEVVAISSSTVEDHREVADDIGATFPILADPEGEVIRAWGLLHPDAIPLTGLVVSRPAVFIIAPDGTVRRRFLTENWRVRLRPEHLLAALREEQRERSGEPNLEPLDRSASSGGE